MDNLYLLESDGVTINKYYEKGNQLSYDEFKDSIKSFMVHSLSRNPFTNKSLTKGEKLYFQTKRIFVNRTSKILKPTNIYEKFYIVERTSGIAEDHSPLIEVTVG